MGELLPRLDRTVAALLAERESIHPLREANVRNVALYVSGEIVAKGSASIMFLCTHNSRRSQMAQAWGLAAATKFDVPVTCYSGGTGPTRVHESAMTAVSGLGFDVQPAGEGRFSIAFSHGGRTELWSKRYQDASQERSFIAIANCSQADEGCPTIPSARVRLAMLYDDPKIADGRPDEVEVYTACARTIGRELVALFALVQGMRHDRR
jgi:protein-tyrosine-phosphatase